MSTHSGIRQWRRRFSRQPAPLAALSTFSAMLGTTVMSTAARTSEKSATVGVEMSGKPKPESPWAMPAAKTTAQVAAMPPADSSRAAVMERSALVLHLGGEAEEAARHGAQLVLERLHAGKLLHDVLHEPLLPIVDHDAPQGDHTVVGL